MSDNNSQTIRDFKLAKEVFDFISEKIELPENITKLKIEIEPEGILKISADFFGKRRNVG